MKIGVDGAVFHGQLSGVGLYNYNLLLALANCDDVSIVIYSYRDARFPEHDSILIKKSPFSSVLFSQLWRAMVPLFCFIDKVDVFIAGNGLSNMLQFKRTVLVVHDFVYRFFPETMSFKGLLSRYLLQPFWVRRAEAIICNSQATANDLERLSSRRADKVIRPFSQFDSSVKHAAPVPDLPQRFILVVGTLEPRKNLVTLIQAYNKYIECNPSSFVVPLVFVGRAGWKYSNVFDLVEKYPERYKLLDYLPREQLVWLYQNALFCWMPSLYEGFGMPLLEARLLGCPIVCSDVPAMREAAGEQALFHQTDHESIYAMVNALYESKFSILRQPDASDVNWNWDTGARQMMKILEKVIAAK